MNVLGICGSPHPDGNTAYALRHALRTIEGEGIGTTYLSLADYEIRPCKGCFACREGTCVQEDGMAEVADAIYHCDGLILASPVYMGLVTGQMKVMMDRTVLFRTGGRFELSGKVGAGIACGGFRNGGQELTLQAMHTFFLQQDMYAVADGPGYSHSGAAIVGRAETDQVGLQTVENLARRVARAVREMRGEA
ncbi:MAG TPA: flavodoxin family protein [Anaerolineae bacterium]|nr:flavodoxin family protein [Anaerolineae bacterium]